jgi:hypothetical protein
VVDINHIDYVTCNDLYDGDIIASMPVCLAAVKIVAKVTPAVQFLIGKARGWRDWIDATICMLSRSHPISCGGR